MSVPAGRPFQLTRQPEPVFDAAEREAQSKLERRRAKNVAANRRYRERHGDAERQRNTEYKRAWRARRRQEQGLSPAVQPQPVVTREELERQLEEAQAELERQRALRRDRKKRWEERHPEEARRKHAEYERARYARRRQQATGSSDSEPGGHSLAP